MVTTGVLAFGAGILVNGCSTTTTTGTTTYRTTATAACRTTHRYPYRPVCGGGCYPSHGCNRPPNYSSGWRNSSNIIISTGGSNRPGNGYWIATTTSPVAAITSAPARSASPITAAKPEPELNDLSKRQPRAMPADVKRPSPDATAQNWKARAATPVRRTRSKMSSLRNASPAPSQFIQSLSQGRHAMSAPAPKGAGLIMQARPRIAKARARR